MPGFLTPLRYPGGKQKLAPFVAEIIRLNNLAGAHYAEPYCGGAGVAIQLLLDGTVSRIFLNDSCFQICAFWRSVIGQSEEFCRRILSASLTPAEWQRQHEIFRRPTEFDVLDVGFSTFFLNRCNRSGILTAGMIGGKKQTGKWKIDARFPRNDLIRRIEAIASKSDDIIVSNLDAEAFLDVAAPLLPESSLIYCDPPYFHKADRLYLNHYQPDDHARIAKAIRKLPRPWLVSYDAAPEIIGYYKGASSFCYDLQYSANEAYVGSEVFFFAKELSIPATSAVPCVEVALRQRK